GGRVGVVGVGGGREGGWGGEEGGNFYRVKRDPDRHWHQLVGDRFEALSNIEGPYRPPKLKAPLQRFVTEGATALAPVESESFDAVVSLAQGGLANAWGAQLYRFAPSDLCGFPISLEELDPYYQILTEHIGISGTADDLARFYGPTAGLLPPLRLALAAERVLSRYQRRRERFNRSGVFLGRPRLAVLPAGSPDRPPWRPCSL